MNYIHDIGGLHGFGPVPDRHDELQFHAAWEARTFALMRALLHNGVFAVDEFRHAVERMEPAAYLSATYFERWVDAIERLCVERGLITAAERDKLVDVAHEKGAQ